jgi:pimeloyl-ACP methyl ester carboxylesterase
MHFRRYAAQISGQGRAVTFYVSERPSSQGPKPLVVWIQGTGCESHFSRDGGGGVAGGLLTIVRDAAAGRAVVVGVEKPGVTYFDPPPEGNARCPAAFLRDFTLNDWTDTITAAIDAARTLPGVDTSRVLVLGHSEGGMVAAHVANVARNITHVASLAGGGPSYLSHIADFVRKNGGDPEESVYPCWARVEAEPSATDKFCWGGTYRQWSSFMRTSLIHEALVSRAHLYFIHGSADQQNTIAGFDVLRAELAAHHKAAVFERLKGADHALDVPGDKPPEGLKRAFNRVIRWFCTPE